MVEATPLEMSDYLLGHCDGLCYSFCFTFIGVRLLGYLELLGEDLRFLQGKVDKVFNDLNEGKPT